MATRTEPKLLHVFIDASVAVSSAVTWHVLRKKKTNVSSTWNQCPNSQACGMNIALTIKAHAGEMNGGWTAEVGFGVAASTAEQFSCRPMARLATTARKNVQRGANIVTHCRMTRLSKKYATGCSTMYLLSDCVIRYSVMHPSKGVHSFLFLLYIYR